ncbi:phosphopantetheine-binding protein [Vibrio sp. PP-XX7]
MIPRNIYVTHEIPLTVNNKVDMKRLHDISSKLLPTVKNKAANTALEVEILSVWKAVLELDEIDIDCDFFSLGGNSSLILKVYMELTKVYGSVLFVADLFKYRNISSLARYISDKQSLKTNIAHNEIAPRSEKRINRLKNRKQQKQALSEA